MFKRSLLLVLMAIFSIFFASSVMAAEATITTSYSVITAFGPASTMQQNVPEGEKVIISADKQNAYRVKTIKVTDEAHLIRLMGAATENELTDLQKGLLETYRFSRQAEFESMKTRIPGQSKAIDLNLVDITGYTDTSRYPKITDDFWPQNSRTYRRSGDGFDLHSEIRISGTDCLGYGSDTPGRMKSTFAHEFGHALDKTFIETNAYGFDGSHYINEKIEPKASFAEGFANFIKMIFFPEEEKETRDSLKTVKIEKPQGGYDEYPIASVQISGEGFLDIEAINALIFTRLAADLPDGQKLVLDSFQKHNQQENRMSRFLQNFIKDYPRHATVVAQTLDRETFGRLSDADIRLILGNNADVEKYLTTRSGSNQVPPAAAKPEENFQTITHKSGTIYKWKDAQGNWQFTDQPPQNGTEYSTRGSTATPGKASPVKIENPDTDPFIIGY